MPGFRFDTPDGRPYPDLPKPKLSYKESVEKLGKRKPYNWHGKSSVMNFRISENNLRAEDSPYHPKAVDEYITRERKRQDEILGTRRSRSRSRSRSLSSVISLDQRSRRSKRNGPKRKRKKSLNKKKSKSRQKSRSRYCRKRAPISRVFRESE